MTKCPQCNRTYDEDFAFCLEDGTPLKPSASQQPTLVTPSSDVPPPTLIMPSIESQPPTVVMPSPETQQPKPASTAPTNRAPTAPPSAQPTPSPRPPSAAHSTAPPSGPQTTSSRPLASTPQSTRPPAAVVTHAPPTTSGRPVVAIVIGVLVLILLVVVVASVGVILLNQGQTQNQSSVSSQDSRAPAAAPAANPNPGSTVIPLSDLKNPGSASTGSDSASTEGMVAPGTYQCELTRKMGEGNKVTVALKIVLLVNPDGTYLSRGYMTIPTANIHDQLGVEEKGNYSQTGDTMNLTNRKERQYDLDRGRWKGWAIPDDGAESHEKVRNVTPNTFQLFDDQEKQWFTFTKT